MAELSEIDKNFKVETTVVRDGLAFYNVLQAPFRVYGVFMENGAFRRIPETVAKTVSEGVYSLHAHTSGGRVRFQTDSRRIALSARMDTIGKMPHFALTGSAGFDLYTKEGDAWQFARAFVPPFDMTGGYEGTVEFEDRRMREILIHFPLYSSVNELLIGLDEQARVDRAAPYRIERPVVYYGSSITQGGCASRPGSCYPAILSRRFDCDYINLGFSGNAKGEPEIADYIKGLDMSLFVYDYDHNAPTLAHLAQTHARMFQTIRRKHPTLPILILSRPKARLTEEEAKRRQCIEATYREAAASGDTHVYFADGAQLTALCGDDGTVDNCHPTDYGFASMAEAVGGIFKQNGCLSGL